MTRVKFIFLLLFPLWFTACKSKFSTHEIVNVNNQEKTSDDIYIKYLTSQIDQFPKTEGNYLKLASIYKKIGEDKNAFDILLKAEREMPESANINILLSKLYLQEENIVKLSATIKKIQKIDSENIEFLKLSAAYSLLLDDYTNAIFFTNRALLINPFDNEILFLRGNAQLINYDSISALASFKEAYELKKSHKNFSSMYFLLLAVEEKENAKLYLEEFETNISDDQLCFEWGVYYAEIGERDSAKMILLNCSASGNDETKLDFELARLYFMEGDMDSTFLFINKYIASTPKSTEGYVLKAKALEKISYYTEAKKLYSTALEIDSNSAIAKNGLNNLERKVAYLRIKNKKDETQRQTEMLKPLNSREIN